MLDLYEWRGTVEGERIWAKDNLLVILLIFEDRRCHTMTKIVKSEANRHKGVWRMR